MINNERLEFLKENVVGILEERDKTIERQKLAITRLEEQIKSLKARKTWLGLVRDFHLAFNRPVRSKPFFLKEDIDLRTELIREEFEELLIALGYDHSNFSLHVGKLYKEININPVEVADALADLLYVVIGGCLDFGIPIDPIFREVHNSNMTKFGSDGKPVYREDGKVIKGPNFRKPNIEKYIGGGRSGNTKKESFN